MFGLSPLTRTTQNNGSPSETPGTNLGLRTQNPTEPTNKRLRELGDLFLSGKQRKIFPNLPPSQQVVPWARNNPTTTAETTQTVVLSQLSPQKNPSDLSNLKKPRLFLTTKITEILKKEGPKTFSELHEKLSDETDSRIISNALLRLLKQKIISRALLDPSKSDSRSNPYRYSYIPPHSKDASKTNDSIASVEATETVALSQLAPKKTLSNLTPLEDAIFKALQNGPKIVEDLISLTSCTNGGIQKALKSLFLNKLINRRYKEYSLKGFVYFIPSVDSSNEPPVNELNFLQKEIINLLTETKYLTCKDLCQLIKNPKTETPYTKVAVNNALKKLRENKKIDRTKTIQTSDGTPCRTPSFCYFILSTSNEEPSNATEPFTLADQTPLLAKVVGCIAQETPINLSNQTTTTSTQIPLFAEAVDDFYLEETNFT